MTVTIPNYFIDQKHPSLVQLDENLYIENSRTKQQKVLVRNTMHGLTFIQNGHKEVTLKGKHLTIPKEHAILFSQGNYFTNLNSPDYDAITLFFDDRYIIDFVKKYHLRLTVASSATMTISYSQKQTILRLVASLMETHEEKQTSNTERLKLQIEMLLLELHHYYPKQTEAFFRHILQTSDARIRYILEENIDILHSVSDMHTLLRMSPSHFHKRFVEHFGESPKKWLDKQRIEKAKFLLSSSDRSIGEIATECGYATASWFTAQFKKYCKTTPNNYRRENRHHS